MFWPVPLPLANAAFLFWQGHNNTGRLRMSNPPSMCTPAQVCVRRLIASSPVSLKWPKLPGQEQESTLRANYASYRIPSKTKTLARRQRLRHWLGKNKKIGYLHTATRHASKRAPNKLDGVQVGLSWNCREEQKKNQINWGGSFSVVLTGPANLKALFALHRQRDGVGGGGIMTPGA